MAAQNSHNVAALVHPPPITPGNRKFLNLEIWRPENKALLWYIVEQWPKYLSRAQLYQAMAQLGGPNSEHYRPHAWGVTHDG